MMTSAVLRVILRENSCQRVVFPSGLPETFMDALFDNQFMNLTSMDEIQDKATVKTFEYCCSCFMYSSTFASRHSEQSSSCSSNDTIMLSSPNSTTSKSSWPDSFCIPRFSYDAEFKLEQANSVFREKGTLLIPDIKLKSDILEGLIQEIVQYKVYVTDRESKQVAEALIKRHACFAERGSDT
ncbi:hypothetical protein Z043_126297, partial [Scleropages formosus]